MQLVGYTFGAKIGEGGMARVYRGEQLSLSRPVAIKVLDRQMRKHSQVLKAFERESLIIARLSHPNIIHVIDRGVSEEGSPYFVMEFVDGIDLSVMLREGQLPIARKLELALQVCKALSYAHQNGVIHRDIKPSNVIVDAEFNARVLDFGISQFSHDDSDVPSSGGENDVMGTLSYLAPELHNGAQATEASDIYSLGLLIFEMLVGHLPKEGRLSVSDYGCQLTASLDATLKSCLSPDPDLRPVSVALLTEQLLLCLHGAHLSRQQVAAASNTLDKKTFTLLDVISDNSFGAVYLFAEKQTAKQLLVKKCNLAEGSQIQAGAGYTSAKRLAALAKEGEGTSNRHMHLARVHGASKNTRAFIVVMDYLSGGSLQQRMVRRYSVDEFLVIARQVCAGLEDAHRNNIMHGNLRASNLLFDDKGVVKLADFGLPPHYCDDEQEALQPSLRQENWYRLPKEPLSIAADIYAAGVIFYQMLVGELPRTQQGQLQAGRAFRGLPKELQSLLRQMLMVKPDLRLGSASIALQKLNDLNNDLATACWQPSNEQLVAAQDKTRGERKKVLLLSLLVLLFTVMLNTGLITVFGSDNLLALLQNLAR